MFEQKLFPLTAVTKRLKLQRCWGGKGLGGSIVEPPWKQTREIGTAWLKVQSRRYARLIRSGFTANCKRLRWQETCNGTPAPCLWRNGGGKPFVQGGTHTHTPWHLTHFTQNRRLNKEQDSTWDGCPSMSIMFRQCWIDFGSA